MKYSFVICSLLLTVGCDFLHDHVDFEIGEKITIEVSDKVAECQMEGLLKAVDEYNVLFNTGKEEFDIVITPADEVGFKTNTKYRTIFVYVEDIECSLDEEGREICPVGLGGHFFPYASSKKYESYKKENPDKWVGTITISPDYCYDDNYNLWMHEIGHVFSLPHIEEDYENYMYPQLSLTERYFTDDQVDQLRDFALTEEDLQNVN